MARFQANLVKQKLAEIGLESQIVIIRTKGDEIQNRSLQSLGTGIFTKALDDALINGIIDIAIHSMKDVPTVLFPSLCEFAVLERGDDGDVLVVNDPSSHLVATGSIRRKAQWLRRYPNDVVADLRGNVETRMEKVKRSDWKGGIFAKAGLVRLNRHLDLDESMDLDWMIPAPAQGAIAVIGRSGERTLQERVYQLNHHESSLAVAIERTFFKHVGRWLCSANWRSSCRKWKSCEVCWMLDRTGWSKGGAHRKGINGWFSSTRCNVGRSTPK